VSRLALAVAMACLATAAGQAADDEFSLLDLPRPSAGAMLSGFPMMNLGRLLDGFEEDAQQQGEGAAPRGGKGVRVFQLPPALSGLLLGGASKPQPVQRPVVRMHIGLPFMLGSAGLSRPLQELRSLASGCVPCGRAQAVQSHMRSVSVMHGPDGQRVETITETGPDGEEHTTRTVTKDGDESDLDDILSAVTEAPLMGGMPDFERIMDDIEGIHADSQPAKVAAPAAEAPKQVSADDAKSAVETALAAEGLELGSSEKRQDLAASIAEKLGVSPSSVKVTAQGDNSGDAFEDEDGDAETDEEAEDEDENEDEDEDDDEVDDEVDDEGDVAGEADDESVDSAAADWYDPTVEPPRALCLEDATEEPPADEGPADEGGGCLEHPTEEPPADKDDADDDAEDADQLGKEFEEEEEERQSVLRQEEQTEHRVARAAEAASNKAEEQKRIADRLNKLENHINGVLA